MTPSWFTAMALRSRLPRRTVRLRLALMYGGLFLISGAVLLAVTYALVAHAIQGVISRRFGIVGSLPMQQQRLVSHLTAAELHTLLAGSGIALGLMAVLSIALGLLIADRVLRPLRTITAATRQVSAASLGERLALGGPDDELKELGDTIDGLLGRLEASFRAQRQFIANASHELRTPLARQRVISQVALADPAATIESLRAAHERVLASGAQQHQLIEALLTLARGQAGLGHREPFDLAAVTSQVLAARESEAQHRRLTLHAALGPAPAAGSARLVEHLAANLGDNALYYNVPGGRVDITTGTRDCRAVLTVANTGPAVPAAEVDRLFRPFQRLGTERTNRGEGLGLGLSIVQAIADTHHASVTARPQPGGGLLVEVTFADPGAHAARLTPGIPVHDSAVPGPAVRPGDAPCLPAGTRACR